MAKPLLLVQPLKIDDIQINILPDEEEQEPQALLDQDIIQQALYPITEPTIDNIIDDAELLAILGFPPSQKTTPTLSFIDSNTLLDWEDMPELSESEDDSSAPLSLKRKATDEDDEEVEDFFAQYDFEEVNLIYPTSEQQQQAEAPEEPTNKKLKIDESAAAVEVASI
jgi:hypothetical protein